MTRWFGVICPAAALFLGCGGAQSNVSDESLDTFDQALQRGCYTAGVEFVAIEPAPLRTAGSSSASVLTTVPQGDHVSAVATHGDGSCSDDGWFKVRYGERTGWMYEERLRLKQGPRGVSLWGVMRGVVISGYNEYRPWAGAQNTHKGVDVACQTHQNIRAIGRARVYRVRDNNSVSGYHQEVTLYYPSVDRYVLYGHLLRGLPVFAGQTLAEGDLIGHCGTQTDAMGGPTHTHVQVWPTELAARYYDNSMALNPEPVRQALGE